MSDHTDAPHTEAPHTEAPQTDAPHTDNDATEFEEFLDAAAEGELVADQATGASGEPEHTQPLTEVEELTIEVQEFKNMALRLQADFENYRKRVTAQQHDDIDRATGRFAESLLPVLDACEAAFAHGADAVQPIWSQLMGVLQKQGLEALDLADKPFDPEHADAVMHEPGDGGEAVVSEVLRTGYTWKGKTLRAAMVKVKG
ncbi:MAG: nucleotide exchange factor GrpE [Ilumatobacteraceae bacterium]